MRTIGIVALGAAFVMAATPVAAAPARRAAAPGAVRMIYPTAPQLVQLWAREPVVGPEIVALRRVFPNEVLHIAQTALAKAKAGASDADISAYVFSARQDLMRENLWFAGLAPDDKIKAYIDGQAAHLEALERTDLVACAASTAGGKTRGASAAGVIETNVAQIALIEAGRASPVRHEAPTSDDTATLIAAVRRHGVTDAEAGALLTGTVKDLPQTRLCHVGVAAAEALNEIPLDVAVRLTAAAMSPAEKRPAGETPEQHLAARWARDPILGSIMPELIAQMPDEMNAILGSMVERAKAGDAAGESEAFVAGFSRLVASHMDAVAAAPPEKIAQVGQLWADYMLTLQSLDPHCGLDKPPAPVASTELDLADKRLTRGLGELLLAGRAALDRDQVRLERKPTAADRKIVLDRLRAATGGGPLYEAVAQGKTDDLPLADRCQSNRLTLQAMLASPEPSRGNLLVAYLRDIYVR